MTPNTLIYAIILHLQLLVIHTFLWRFFVAVITLQPQKRHRKYQQKKRFKTLLLD
jgi:hypothetical protein